MAAKFDMIIAAKTTGQAAIKRMGNSMQGLQGRLKNVRMAALSVNTAFKAMALILTAGTFSRFVTGAINQADAFGKLSRQTGIAADSLQAYVNAGKLAGVEQSTIEKGLRRLAQSQREADQGIKTYSESYEALGISVRDSDGNLKSSEVLLGDIADRFSNMPNGATKAALAMEIFGRSGAQLIPLLNEGREELEKWNYETSEGFAANAEYFNDQLTKLSFGFDGFRKLLADALLPTLNQLVGVFSDVFDSEKDWAGLFKVIEIAIRGVAFSIMGAIALAEELIQLAKTTKEIIGKWVKGDFTGMDETKAEWRSGFANRFKTNKELFDSIIGGTENAPASYFAEGTVEANKFGKELDKTFGTQMKSKIDTFRASIKTVGEAMSDVVIKGIKKMEETLVNFVMTGKLAFKDLANTIIKEMARIAIQQTITAPLTDWFKGLFSAKGNVIENGQHVTAYAKGGVINSPHYKMMANGGIAVAGEAGAEAILPLRRRNGILGVEGGGNTSVVVNVDANQSQVQGDSDRAGQLGEVISQAIQQELIVQRRPGGLLAT